MRATVHVDQDLVRGLEQLLKQPVFFKDVLVRFSGNEYREILRAWSDVRSRLELSRDELGRYWINPSLGAPGVPPHVLGLSSKCELR
jgi:hypothetical protein